MSDSGSSGGISFAGALLLLFIGLKLGGAIDWSWWWVLAPFWLPVGVVLAVTAVGGACCLVYWAMRETLVWISGIGTRRRRGW